MTSRASRRLLLVTALGLALAACSDRSSETAAPADNRQLQVAPAPPAPPPEPAAPPAQAAAPKRAAPANVVESAVQDPPVEPDEQVREDAAASGMTSRTTTTTTTTESTSSMSNLY